MKKYQGKISGVGNAITRQNEITADDLAISRNYIYGWEYGVINREGWNFNARIEGNSVIVEKGIMFAYGYFGIFPKTYTIPFIKPSATQYRFIYAEIDRSVVPNTCTIKVKNNQGSDKIKPTTFRQDYLTAVRTGVFQLPLWRVELNSEGIKEVVDVRDLKDYIMKVEHTKATTKMVTGEISLLAKATTQPITDNSEKLATTEFVKNLCRKQIGYKELRFLVSIELIGTEKNQVAPLESIAFYQDEGVTRKNLVVTCPESVSVRFRFETGSENIEMIEDDITVHKENGIKTVYVPIEIYNWNISGIVPSVIYVLAGEEE